MSYSSEELLLDFQLKMILLFLILVLGVIPQPETNSCSSSPFRQFCCDWLLSLTKVNDQNVGGAYVPKMTMSCISSVFERSRTEQRIEKTA